MMSRYEHTQRAPLFLILLTVSLAAGTGAVFSGDVAAVRRGLQLLSVGLAVLASCFTQLTVRDTGDRLVVRFGWLPVFGWSARWDEIESAEPGRSSWIDGWGVHWVPGRGMTLNLWGLDCVDLKVRGRTVRVGTDDAERLAGYIQHRIAGQDAAGAAAQ